MNFLHVDLTILTCLHGMSSWIWLVGFFLLLQSYFINVSEFASLLWHDLAARNFLMINASANFIIYVFASRRFRQELKRWLHQLSKAILILNKPWHHLVSFWQHLMNFYSQRMYLLGEKDSPRMYTGHQYFQHFNGDIWHMIMIYMKILIDLMNKWVHKHSHRSWAQAFSLSNDRRKIWWSRKNIQRIIHSCKKSYKWNNQIWKIRTCRNTSSTNSCPETVLNLLRSLKCRSHLPLHGLW